MSMYIICIYIIYIHTLYLTRILETTRDLMLCTYRASGVSSCSRRGLRPVHMYNNNEIIYETGSARDREEPRYRRRRHHRQNQIVNQNGRNDLNNFKLLSKYFIFLFAWSRDRIYFNFASRIRINTEQHVTSSTKVSTYTKYY